MKKFKRLIVVLLVGVMSLCVLVGCGGGKATESEQAKLIKEIYGSKISSKVNLEDKTMHQLAENCAKDLIADIQKNGGEDFDTYIDEDFEKGEEGNLRKIQVKYEDKVSEANNNKYAACVSFMYFGQPDYEEMIKVAKDAVAENGGISGEAKHLAKAEKMGIGMAKNDKLSILVVTIAVPNE